MPLTEKAYWELKNFLDRLLGGREPNKGKEEENYSIEQR